MTGPGTDPLLVPALSRSSLDRVADRRKDEAWLAQRWDDPATRVLLVDGEGRAPVADEADGPVLVLAGPDRAPAGVQPHLLGADDGPGGVAYFSVVVPEGTSLRLAGARPRGLREVGALLSARDSGLLTQAVGLANWHATHTHCPRCGAATEVREAGWSRACPVDGSHHFPRTDPAVIMLVHDGGERCLLGRQTAWPPGRFSTLAGFVEPGESLEAAVAREVREESGVVVTDVSYEASQPWPFPASLMLGFTARAVDPAAEAAPQQGDGELAEVRWWSREELRRDIHAGALRLPPPVSIAWRLISRWYGEALPGGW